MCNLQCDEYFQQLQSGTNFKSRGKTTPKMPTRVYILLNTLVKGHN